MVTWVSVGLEEYKRIPPPLPSAVFPLMVTWVSVGLEEYIDIPPPFSSAELFSIYKCDNKGDEL